MLNTASRVFTSFDRGFSLLMKLLGSLIGQSLDEVESF